MTSPQPGDFAVVSAGGPAGLAVRWAERLILEAGPYAAYQHAFIYLGEGVIIQAEPKGATYGQLTAHASTLWSTGKFALDDVQRDAICDAARGYVGTPYSALDYVAIALHHWRIPVPGLKTFIKATGHMICSQLCDRVYQDAGVQIFNDHRWNGYVTPAALAKRLETM